MALRAAGIRIVHLAPSDDEARDAWQGLAGDDDDRLPEESSSAVPTPAQGY